MMIRNKSWLACPECAAGLSPPHGCSDGYVDYLLYIGDREYVASLEIALEIAIEVMPILEEFDRIQRSKDGE
jgi:hypothetical protein